MSCFQILVTFFWFFLFQDIAITVILGQQQPDIQQSAEYQLRNALFKAYDKMVRPVLKPSDVVNVTFDVEFKALHDVYVNGCMSRDNVLPFKNSLNNLTQRVKCTTVFYRLAYF
ncbi:hypothetical protein OS493_025921 [Desmophyllum pertusum]|uniref:Uncharacterized protein n=1 Tax=Desmophyllum pertusum TaxID=174260 RepID=A0A9W9YY06_9CNID|nr:hypothetical protein OS493_025921 [Desmophyllum pertusum]